MNYPSHFNYPRLYNQFNPNARLPYPSYTASYESYGEDHDAQEYMYLPKPVSFFDSYMPNPLDATRHSTDMTDASDGAYHSYKEFSPTAKFHRSMFQDPRLNFGNADVKTEDNNAKTTFTALFGASSGIAYNSTNPADSRPVVQDQPHPTFLAEDRPVFTVEKVKQEGDDMEAEQGQDGEEEDVPNQGVLNAQLKSLMESKIWSEDKDEQLLKLGAQYKCDWKKIAKRFNHKKITPHFLKIRYKELICAPLQRRIKFNHREDLMIAKYFEKYGSNWGQMAGHFKDRTAIMLKNRYYSYIRKRDLLDSLLKEVKEIEQDDLEIDEIKEHDSGKYSALFNTNSDDMKPNPKVSMNEEDHSVKTGNSDQHPIFGYENDTQAPVSQGEMQIKAPYMTEDPAVGHQNLDQSKEIEQLKAKVKSLQFLYMKAKHELDELKAKGTN